MLVIYWLSDSLIVKELSPNLLCKFSEYFNLTMYGQFYGSITPFSSGGQPAQVLYLKNRGISVGKSISVLTQKIFITQLCTVIVSSLSLIFKGHKFRDSIPAFDLLVIIGLIIQCSGVASIVLFYSNKNKFINSIHHILKIGERMKIIKDSDNLCNKINNHLSFLIKNNLSIDYTFSTFFYCFLQNLSMNAMSFFIVKSFGSNNFSIFDSIAAQSFVTLISITTPLPGSAGTTEGTFITLYKKFINQEKLISIMILFRTINYYLGIITSEIIITISNHKTKKTRQKRGNKK